MFISKDEKLEIQNALLGQHHRIAALDDRIDRTARDLVGYHNEQENDIVALRKDVDALRADIALLVKAIRGRFIDVPAKPEERLLKVGENPCTTWR